jgi:UDP-glucose 4-epimerase
VSHVVHLAGLAHADPSTDDGSYRAINAEATRALATAAHNAGTERLVFISSTRAQTGPTSKVILTEADPPTPTDPYGRSKLQAERHLAEVLTESQTEWVVLRPAVVFGPGVRGNMHRLIRLAKSPLPLGIGGLKGRRSVISLASLASAIAHALTEPACDGGTFLVADAEALTIPEIVATLRAAGGRMPRIFALPEIALKTTLGILRLGRELERMSGDLVVDAGRLRATGWQPPVAVADALADWMHRDAIEPARLRDTRTHGT